MMVEGPCIRVGPPASQSCLWVKSTIIQVHPAFDLSISLSAIAALMSAASMIIGQQWQRAELTRCIVPSLMTNMGRSWLGFLVEILLKNRRAVDKSKKKNKAGFFSFFFTVREPNTGSSYDPHDQRSLPPVRGKAMFKGRVLKSKGG